MSLWIFDTDSVSLFQRRHPLVCQRVTTISSEEIATTIVTVEEQLRGRFDAIRKVSSVNELVPAYTRLWATVSYFSSINRARL